MPNCLNQSPRPTTSAHRVDVGTVLPIWVGIGIHQYVFHSGRPGLGLTRCVLIFRGIRSTLAHVAHFNLVEQTGPPPGPSLHSLVLSVVGGAASLHGFNIGIQKEKSNSLVVVVVVIIRDPRGPLATAAPLVTADYRSRSLFHPAKHTIVVLVAASP